MGPISLSLLTDLVQSSLTHLRLPLAETVALLGMLSNSDTSPKYWVSLSTLISSGSLTEKSDTTASLKKKIFVKTRLTWGINAYPSKMKKNSFPVSPFEKTISSSSNSTASSASATVNLSHLSSSSKLNRYVNILFFCNPLTKYWKWIEELSIQFSFFHRWFHQNFFVRIS